VLSWDAFCNAANGTQRNPRTEGASPTTFRKLQSGFFSFFSKTHAVNVEATDLMVYHLETDAPPVTM